MKTIEVKNRGPVRNCTIEIPEDGGVVVLVGDNGSGKSETLDGIDRLLGRKDKQVVLTATDGTDKGYVQGLGVKVTFGRQTRSSGELIVESLEDRLSIADVIDPPIKDPKSADAARVKALLQMAAGPDGVNVQDLVGVLPAAALALLEPEIENVSDAVELTAIVKRLFHKRARTFEMLAASARDEARGLATHENFDDVPPTDVAKANLTNAIKSAAETESITTFRKETRVQIGAYQGKPSTETCEELNRVIDAAATAKDLAAKLMDELTDAETVVTETVALIEPAKDAHKAALEVELLIETITGDSEGDVEDLANANRIVKSAELAAERATLREAAVKNNRDAAILVGKAAGDDVAAKQSRDWANQAEQSLSMRLREATEGKLFVDDSRVYTMTNRGQTLFGSLSQGERTRIVMELAARYVGTNGIFVADQIFWESLDATNRKLVVDLAVELGVVVVTAEATPTEEESGELHSKVLR